MKNLFYLIFGMVFIGLISCNQTTKTNNSDSEAVSDIQDMSQGNELTACQHATKIYWKGTKPTGEHNGIIKLKEGGKFVVEEGKLVGGKFIIDMTTIANIDLDDEGMNAKLVGHLKSADFFNVDSFPVANFVILEVVLLKGDDAFNTTLKGNLTMKDITHGIEFKANVKINNGNVSAVSEEFVLDRTKWGINYKSKSVFKELKDKFINDEFALKIDAHSM